MGTGVHLGHGALMLPDLILATLAAARQTLSRPLRRILWRSLGLTILLLAALWYLLTQALRLVVDAHPLSADYPAVDSVLVFLAGTGLVIGLGYVLPIVSAFVAGWFVDEAADVVERRDFPNDAPGRALPVGASLAFAARFAGLALLVNAVALILILVPGVNIVAFFAANAYLLGREYFELAAMRFVSPAEASHLRRRHFATALAGGAVLAGLMLVPVVNLVTPIFGIVLMVHLNKRIARRRLPAL